MAASLQILKSAVSPFCSKSEPRELSWRSDSQVFRTRALGFRRRSVVGGGRDRLRVFCKIDEADGKSSGEERPESLFMKELKKRGITPTSLLEESNRSTLDEESQEKGRTKTIPETGADFNRNLTNQREQSMALNSEGLEGLVPRAKLLLTLGGTFFLAFWPLILVTVSAFAALYFYFGTSFIHDGSRDPVSPPQYIDPYVLLQEERISGMAPRVK